MSFKYLSGLWWELTAKYEKYSEWDQALNGLDKSNQLLKQFWWRFADSNQIKEIENV